jgi:hypothetical protein
MAHRELEALKEFAKHEFPCAAAGVTVSLEAAAAATDAGAVFGQPLAGLVMQDAGALNQNVLIPRAVQAMFDYLEVHGTTVEGIFRRSGSHSRVRELKAQMDAGDYSLTGATAIDAACLLKLFFRLLPEPLLTYELRDAFVEAANLTGGSEKLRAFRLILTLLPPSNLAVLRGLLNLMGAIVDGCDAPDGGSKMPSPNLAMVMGLNLLKKYPSAAGGALSWQDPLNQIGGSAPKKKTPLFKRLLGRSSGSKSKSLAAAASAAAAASIPLDDGSLSPIACMVVEDLIDLREHLFAAPADLRDEALQYLNKVAPARVSAILWGLITSSRPPLGSLNAGVGSVRTALHAGGGRGGNKAGASGAITWIDGQKPRNHKKTINIPQAAAAAVAQPPPVYAAAFRQSGSENVPPPTAKADTNSLASLAVFAKVTAFNMAANAAHAPPPVAGTYAPEHKRSIGAAGTSKEQVDHLAQQHGYAINGAHSGNGVDPINLLRSLPYRETLPPQLGPAPTEPITLRPNPPSWAYRSHVGTCFPNEQTARSSVSELQQQIQPQYWPDSPAAGSDFEISFLNKEPAGRPQPHDRMRSISFVDASAPHDPFVEAGRELETPV